MSGVKPQWAAPTGADLAERSAKANTTGPSVGSAAGDDLAEGQHCSLVPLFILLFIFIIIYYLFFIFFYYFFLFIYFYFIFIIFYYIFIIFFLTINLRKHANSKESSSWPKAHAFNNPSCGL